MSRVLIIGAGGVAGVTVKKCARLPEHFNEIYLASRTVSKCEALQAECGGKGQRGIRCRCRRCNASR